MLHRLAVFHRAEVKRAYVELRERADQSELFHLTGSKGEDIDIVMTVDEVADAPSDADETIGRGWGGGCLRICSLGGILGQG